MRSIRGALLVSLLLLASGPVPAAAAVAGARGDWPQWRGTPQHTGFQSVAGRINRPRASRIYRLGGAVPGPQVLIAPPSARRADRIVLIATAGSMQARSVSGRELWQRRYLAQASIWTLADLDADGSDEFITTSVQNGVVHLEVLNVDDGASRWSVTAAAPNVGDIAIGDVEGDGKPELVWLPAGNSVVRAFSFKRGYSAAQLLWENDIAGYNSDPYTPSVIVIEEQRPQKSVIIFGGRGETSIVTIEGSNGVVRARQSYVADPTGRRVTEGGGLGQMLALRDVDGDGEREIVAAALWPSLASYMFQGGVVAEQDRARRGARTRRPSLRMGVRRWIAPGFRRQRSLRPRHLSISHGSIPIRHRDHRSAIADADRFRDGRSHRRHRRVVSRRHRRRADGKHR